ncbi:sensor histidine kinase [Rubrivirga litoralis]|uniref:Oxygen sensor histidine kinase NreB n=1 Tax=Rubrivirga litoralis TaxID=3075598 RepID=A0ABU3BSG8_9BACT|nr:PAS domain-containing protein [Rubrivirga sp. F394]MDT0632229.1 PAS domain-containing protein [Rubrivirga sp. F394]
MTDARPAAPDDGDRPDDGSAGLRPAGSPAGETEGGERLALALRAGRMGTWHVDVATDRATVDAQEAELLGLAPGTQTIAVADFFACIHPDDRAQVAEAVARSGDRDQDYQAEFRVVRPDGSVRWLSAAGRTLRDAGGQPATVVGINADVTERKRAEAELRRVSARLVQAGEDERRRIARDLHDELGGLLTSLQMSLRMNPARLPEARAELAESEALVKAMARRVRELSLDLRPSLLDDLGLGPALDQLTARFARRTGVAVDLRCEVESGERFAPEVETTAYRIVQEALTNVARHAGADRAQVLCHREPSGLVVHVVDEGHGFEEGAGGAASSTGLSVMRERAALVGGACEVVSDPGAGTRVTARLPLP